MDGLTAGEVDVATTRSAVRLVGAIVLLGLLLGGGAVASVAWLWSRDGLIHIEVDDGPGGDRVSLSAPAWLLRLEMLSGTDLHLGPEDRAWITPLRAALSAWGETPDGVVLRSAGPDGSITVAKRGEQAILRVMDGPGRVAIELPARSLRRLLPPA